MKQAKRLFSLLLALTLVLTCAPHIPLKAAAATDGYYTYTVTNGEATITDVSASISGDITIPSTLGGYPVTTIGSDAFYYCSKLASVTIPNSVTTIGDYAFQDCIKLKNIFFDGKAPNIVGRAFSNVTATAYYYPDETWTKDVMRDYSGNITWVALEKACEIIAFGICGAHATWVLDKEGTLTISGTGAMYNAETFNDTPWAPHRLDIKKVTIGSSVTTIGDNAFESCPSLTSVTIGDSVTTIGSYVFYECTKLTSVTIGNSVTTIGDFTFSGCIGLTSITIPNSVTTIREYAFYECSKLTSVTIGNSVTTIGECAFDTCRSLTSVTIPNSVTTIGRYAFWNCDVLTKIYFDGSAPAIGNDAFCNVTATAYYYPDETWTEDMMQKYGSKITWFALEKGLKIVAFGICGANVTWALDEEGTLTISGSGPMYDCETSNDVPWADHNNDIQKVIIGDSVTTIGSFMFSYCSRLTSIDIPDSVTTIGFNAFRECTELFSLVIPASVTLIDYYAFCNCICLDEIYFEGSAPRICVDVFYNTNAIKLV